MKKLSELYPGYPDIEINDIKINSKEIEKNDLFVCTMGVNADRHDFIEDAIKNGASAIVVSKDVECSIPTIKVENTNEELPRVASRFYNHPENDLEIIGITGTNGKTTVATIIQDLIGRNICAYMGTNGLIYSDKQETIVNTTPDADRLYKYFRRFVDNGCHILSMEASSESFYRKRLTNLKFKIGVVTNITEDHLNIHKTIENYVACKKELLNHITEDGYIILNSDDEHFEELLKSASAKAKNNILTYGKKESTLQIMNYVINKNNTEITLKYKDNEYTFTSPMLGEFNIYNLCAAILVLLALGYEFNDILPRINNINSVAGRVEFLNYGQNYDIVLDYAHTKDAFSKIYDLLLSIKKGRLITITGSAGGREVEKRGPIGKLVLDKSDYVIFTMDDPRNEDVSNIIKDLVSESDKTNYEIILNRKEAIYHAFDIAKENDIVLVAGKGIDNYMAIGNEYLPYSDLEVIEEYFK